MSTNYYATIDPCSHCGRADDIVHLGKQSAGWKFLFNYNHGEYYTDYDSFVAFIQNNPVHSEYGHIIEPCDLLASIEARQSDKSHAKVFEGPEYNAFYIWREGYEFIDTEFS